MGEHLIMKLGKWYLPDKPVDGGPFYRQWNLDKFCKSKGWTIYGGYASAWDLRDPIRNKSIASHDKVIIEWHHDPERVCDRAQYNVLWSSTTPTLIKRPNGNVFQAQDYEVVIFNNIACEHRMPDNIGHNRWTIRGWNMKRTEKE